MKLFALTTATALVLAGAASASSFEAEAQRTLNEFGFSVDAGSLSRTQLVGINAADNDSDRTAVEVQAAIASVLKN